MIDAFSIEHGMEQTSMTNAIKKRLDRKGFTLAEVLVTVAIILILAGVTFVSVAQYQKNLRLMEMDGTAKEIFIAAQNHLSVAQASGDLDRLAEDAKQSATGTTASPIGTKLLPAPSYAGNTDGEYYYVIHNVTSSSESCTPSGNDTILGMMLPFGALDETVATGGNYAIVYELKSASVVAVLYSGAGNASFGNAAVINLEDADVNAIPTLYNDKSARKSYQKGDVTAIVGCYTGTADSAAIPTETLEAPKLEVKNENKLHVIVREAKNTDKITLVITGEQSGTTARRFLNRDAGAGDGYERGTGTFDVTLDDITGDGTYRFSQLIHEGRFTPDVDENDFIPGENITISAIASSSTALATPKESAKYTVSSLFDDVNETTNSTGDTKVYIKNLRHLENLGANVSDFTAALGKDTTSGHYNVVNITAVQKNDITMFSFNGLRGETYNNIYGSGTFTSTYIAANVDYPLSYDGGYHEIYDLTIAGYHKDNVEANAGIFGTVTNALSVKNLVLRNDKIPYESSSANAGMLLGKTSADLTVDGVLAYYHEDTYDETKDSSVEVTASQNAGGLIGLVADGTLKVKNSVAAVYVKGGSAAGGLIGSVDGADAGSTIVQSYAGGHTRDGAYSTTDATTNKPVLDGPGRYNVQAIQASGYAGGFIGVTTDHVTMNAVYSTASVYASSGDANSNAFAGSGTPKIKTTADGKKNYYAIGTHNGKDADGEDIEKAQLSAGEKRHQATAYDRTLMGATETTAHPAMDKTSYPLNTIRHLCGSSAEDQDLPWFIKEHVGDWVVSKKTEESNFEVENGNRLTVRINTGRDQITEDVYYEVKVHGQTRGNDAYFLLHVTPDGNVSVQRRFNTEGFSPYNVNIATLKRDTAPVKVDLYLDDITNPYGNFASVFSCDYFYPGEDISINVTSLTSDHDTGAVYDEDKKQYTNSLYGYLQNEGEDASAHNQQKIEAVKKYVSTAGTEENGLGLIKKDDQYYVQIDNSRHLQNLSENVGYPSSQYKIVGAIQTDNIYWSGSSEARSYTLGFQEELGANLSVYSNGNQLTQNGLFCPLAIRNTLISLYDGSGYRISGLAAEKQDNQTAVALFVQPKAEMTVKNLILENVDFSITGSESRAAGLIGYADYAVTIDNVHFIGTLNIKGRDISAGFVPQVNSNVTITNSGIENATISSSDTAAAGLVAYVNGTTTVDKVSFTGNVRITGKEETAGFIAFPFSNITITNSGIEGDTSIISDESEAGGIIGYVNERNATVNNVKVTAKNTEIIAGKNAGGLIGKIEKCPTLNISNAGVSAFVTSHYSHDQAGAGGLIGRIGEAGAGSKIEKSYYGGRTTEGIYGSCTVNKGTEHEHTYDANINGEKSAGGLIGYIGKANGLSIENCFSTGSVNAKSEAAAAGGFIGSSLGWGEGSISIKNCYSMGKVSGTSSSKGGFIGRANGTSTFENVFYYSAFNTVKAPVGNNPGLSDIKVINDPHDILADDDSKTVNTHVYDTPTLEGETYPYKNWTSDWESAATVKLITYYGDWPLPNKQLNGRFVYYHANGALTNGSKEGNFTLTGFDTSLTTDLKNVDGNFEMDGFGIICETPKRADVKGKYQYSFNESGPYQDINAEGSNDASECSSFVWDDGKTYYFFRTTSLKPNTLGNATIYIKGADNTLYSDIIYKVQLDIQAHTATFECIK